MDAAMELAGAFILAAAVSAIACGVAVRARVLDAPGGLVRKGERLPTPTSGGLGIAIGVCAGIIALTQPAGSAFAESLSPDAPRAIAAALGVAAGALAVGLLDDMAAFGPRLKGVVFVVLSVAAPFLIGPVEALPLGFGVNVPLGFVVGLLGSALWMFTIMNTVNFIDGANGLAMGCVAVGCLGLAGASFVVNAPASAATALCVAAALIGFLVWNYPHGKLFAGDAGALFTGALVGGIGLMAVEEGGLSPFVPALIFFPMLGDVLLTLAWRARHRATLLEGHRDHFYQIALRAGTPGWKVALIYWALMAKCALIGVAAAMTPQVPPQAAAEALAEASPLMRGFVTAAAGLASAGTLIAFIVLAGVWIKASNRIRAYAKAHGHDGP